MAKARFDIPTQLPAQIPGLVTKPLHAGVDATSRVVVAVSARVDALGKDLGKDAVARRRAVEQRVADLQSAAEELPTRLQKLVEEQVAVAGDAYSALVKQGEVLVGRIRRQQPTHVTVVATATTKPTTKKSAATTTPATKATAKRTTATKATAKKATAKKATAKKSAPAKTAPKKTAAKKTAAKKTAAKKAAATKSAPAKTTAARA